jgi:hypothetical protein
MGTSSAASGPGRPGRSYQRITLELCQNAPGSQATAIRPSVPWVYLHRASPADSSEATFTGPTGFDGATFTSRASFDRVIFTSDTSFDGATVTRLDDPTLNKRGDGAVRIWPDRWPVCPDTDDPTRGTLIPIEEVEQPDSSSP